MCRITLQKTKGQTVCDFLLDLFVFRDGGAYIAYCPSVDLSTSASTPRGAVSAFREAFTLYFESCREAGTLRRDLEAHGWKLAGGRLTPPRPAAMARKPAMRRLLDSEREFRRVVAKTTAPAFA